MLLQHVLDIFYLKWLALIVLSKTNNESLFGNRKFDKLNFNGVLSNYTFMDSLGDFYVKYQRLIRSLF